MAEASACGSPPPSPAKQAADNSVAGSAVSPKGAAPGGAACVSLPGSAIRGAETGKRGAASPRPERPGSCHCDAARAVAAGPWPAERAPPGGAAADTCLTSVAAGACAAQRWRKRLGNRGGEGGAAETPPKPRWRRGMRSRFAAGGNDVQTDSSYTGPAGSLRQGWTLAGLQPAGSLQPPASPAPLCIPCLLSHEGILSSEEFSQG